MLLVPGKTLRRDTRTMAASRIDREFDREHRGGRQPGLLLAAAAGDTPQRA